MAPQPRNRDFALIVDEDPRSQEVLFELFQGLGYWPVHAADSGQAFEVLHEEVAALVALDVEGPRRAGWEVLEALRHNPAWAALPVFLVTGPGQAEVEVEGCVTNLFRKPLDVDGFLREVKRRLVAGVDADRLH